MEEVVLCLKINIHFHEFYFDQSFCYLFDEKACVNDTFSFTLSVALKGISWNQGLAIST